MNMFELTHTVETCRIMCLHALIINMSKTLTLQQNDGQRDRQTATQQQQSQTVRKPVNKQAHPLCVISYRIIIMICIHMCMRIQDAWTHKMEEKTEPLARQPKGNCHITYVYTCMAGEILLFRLRYVCIHNMYAYMLYCV